MFYEISNDLSEIENLANAVEGFGITHGIAAKDIFAINLSLEELITNTISYGYRDEDEHRIQVQVVLGGDEVQIELQDDGLAFNPLELPSPDTNKSIEERKIGGLGVHLVRTMMDQIVYERRGNNNILHLTKRLHKG